MAAMICLALLLRPLLPLGMKRKSRNQEHEDRKVQQ